MLRLSDVFSEPIRYFVRFEAPWALFAGISNAPRSVDDEHPLRPARVEVVNLIVKLIDHTSHG